MVCCITVINVKSITAWILPFNNMISFSYQGPEHIQHLLQRPLSLPERMYCSVWRLIFSMATFHFIHLARSALRSTWEMVQKRPQGWGSRKRWSRIIHCLGSVWGFGLWGSRGCTEASDMCRTDCSGGRNSVPSQLCHRCVICLPCLTVERLSH